MSTEQQEMEPPAPVHLEWNACQYCKAAADLCTKTLRQEVTAHTAWKYGILVGACRQDLQHGGRGDLIDAVQGTVTRMRTPVNSMEFAAALHREGRDRSE